MAGPGGATCGHLLSHEGTHIWLDAGTGTFARLQEYIGIADIAAIVITHGHTDHFIDVVPAFYARHYGGMGAQPAFLLARRVRRGHERADERERPQRDG